MINNRLVFAASLLVLSACSKKETEQGAFSKTTAEQAAQKQVAQPSQPASQPAAIEEHAAVADGAPFTGELKLGEGIPADTVKPTDVLFVIARQSIGGQPGQIIATTRHADVKLPMKFSIGPDNRMVQGIPFTGPFIVTARIDRDGDPMTRGADDLYATAAGETKAGQADVALVLGKAPANLQQPQQMPQGHPTGTGLPQGHPTVNPH